MARGRVPILLGSLFLAAITLGFAIVDRRHGLDEAQLRAATYALDQRPVEVRAPD